LWGSARRHAAGPWRRDRPIPGAGTSDLRVKVRWLKDAGVKTKSPPKRSLGCVSLEPARDFGVRLLRNRGCLGDSTWNAKDWAHRIPNECGATTAVNHSA
jgi:hypothetical protein